jgi:hypothetical protein
MEEKCKSLWRILSFSWHDFDTKCCWLFFSKGEKETETGK